MWLEDFLSGGSENRPLCLSPHIVILVCVWAYARVQVHTHVEAQGWHGARSFSFVLPLTYQGRISCQLLPRVPCFHFAHAGIIGATTAAFGFCGLWGSKVVTMLVLYPVSQPPSPWIPAFNICLCDMSKLPSLGKIVIVFIRKIEIII